MADHDTILVLDYGTSASQTGHLIARGIRSANVYSEIVYEDEMKKRALDSSIKGFVLPGAPDFVHQDSAPKPYWVLETGKPVLGMCYGHQFIAHARGGEVRPSDAREYGRLLHGVPTESTVWTSHGDSVTKLPEGFDVYAVSENCPVAAFGNDELRLYGFQPHAELFQTEYGEQIPRNFAVDIAGCRPTWTMGSYKDDAMERIRQQVGNEKAIIGYSGGIDSTVTLALAASVLGDRLTVVTVDHGGLRDGEFQEVLLTAKKLFGIDVVGLEESQRFLRRLEGVTDPETKRHIIGEEFANVFLRQAGCVGAACLLQGTIYPDKIETRGGIVTHHNRHKRIHEYFGSRGGLVEPLSELYKDEVRKLGIELGIPEDLIYRSPFPGPGLYIRTREINGDRLRISRHTDRIFLEEIMKLPLSERPWQYLTYVPSERVRGVKGDERAFELPIFMRAFSSRDVMSVDIWRRWDVIERAANRIVNEVRGVTRAVYDMTPKPPGTVEYE